MKREGGVSFFDKTLLSLLGALVIFGLAMLASASWPEGFNKFGDGYYFIKHQVLFGLLPGLILGFIAFKTPYELYRKYAPYMLVLSILLLILDFIPGIGVSFGGSKSWIVIAGISLQPSEIVKLTFLVYLAAWMEKRTGKELKDLATGLLPFAAVLGSIMFLLMLQPDTGSMAVIVFMALAVYFVAGAPLQYFFGFMASGAGLLWILVKIQPYRAERLITFLHPELDPQGVGYHINQALLAIGSGGFLGRGYGHSLQKFQYLPEVAGDSIFAVTAEELGFILTSGFLGLYFALLARGLKVAEEAPDAFAKYLATGIVAWFGIEALINIGAMVGILPITGVTLPFVSYGGTSLAVCLIASGVLLNISGRKKGG